MNTVDLNQLKELREGKKASEERYSRDRSMYLRGRSGNEEDLVETLSGRDRACYMMGYNARNYS